MSVMCAMCVMYVMHAMCAMFAMRAMYAKRVDNHPLFLFQKENNRWSEHRLFSCSVRFFNKWLFC